MKYIILVLGILFLGCNNKNSDHKIALKENQYTIPAGNPSDFGLKDSILNEMTLKIREQNYPNFHSLLIAREGKLVYEKYFTGRDTNFSEDLGVVTHNDTTLHDTRSISKSVVSALIGICIDKGLVESVDQKISEFYPNYEFDGHKANWTLSTIAL